MMVLAVPLMVGVSDAISSFLLKMMKMPEIGKI